MQDGFREFSFYVFVFQANREKILREQRRLVMSNAVAPPSNAKSGKKKPIYLGSSYDLASTYSGGGVGGAAITAPVPDGTDAAMANGLIHAKSTGSLFSGGFKKIKHALK